jgi:GDP-L-fucose synthase
MNVIVTGGSGMVGKYLIELQPSWTYLSSKDLNLLNREEIDSFFKTARPDVVIHLAAKVGGIADNIKYPMEYYSENVLMNTNLIDACISFGVYKFIGVLSSCAYPDVSPMYPLTEDMLHDSLPNVNNLGYGIAKRSMAIQIDIARKLGLNYSYIIPSNLYGKYETGNFFSKHFVGSLLDKILTAERTNSKSITLFGDGTPLRQFTYAGDVASILNELVTKDISENLNVSNDENLTIDQMARMALDVTGNSDIQIHYDSTYPNGQYRKDISIEKLKKVLPGFKFTSYIEGISKTYDHMKTNTTNER